MRLAAAMKLHELGHLSAGAAADLAGISKVAFLHKLADFGVDAFRMTPEEFDQDLDTLRWSLPATRGHGGKPGAFTPNRPPKRWLA